MPNGTDRDTRVQPGHAYPERPTRFARVRRLLSEERGETIVEALLAMTLLGIGFSAIYGALATASIAAQRENQLVGIEAALSTAKRSIADQPFTAVCDSYTLPADPPGLAVTKSCTNSLSGLPGLQEIAIRASSVPGGIVRQAVVYKGSR